MLTSVLGILEAWPLALVDSLISIDAGVGVFIRCDDLRPLAVSQPRSDLVV